MQRLSSGVPTGMAAAGCGVACSRRATEPRRAIEPKSHSSGPAAISSCFARLYPATLGKLSLGTGIVCPCWLCPG